MKINGKILLFSFTGVILAFGTLSFHRWAREHVNYMTSTQSHPLNCMSCHLYLQREGPAGKFIHEDYMTPLNLAVSPNGELLCVTAMGKNELLIIDAIKGNILSEIKVGDHPHSVIINRSGNKAYVSNRWSNNISIVELPKGSIIDTIQVGGGPSGLTLDAEEKFLYVANTYTSDVSVVDLSRKTEEKRLRAGNNPTGLKLSPDGQYVFVVSRKSLPVAYRTPPQTEVTIISTASREVANRDIFREAHIMENIDFSPTGDLALLTLVRPKNLVPSVQVENGWMMNFGIGIINTATDSIYQLSLDEPNEFYADPFGIAITPDGKKAFVSHSGANVISVIDMEKLRKLLHKIDEKTVVNYSNNLGLSSDFVIKRIKTGPNPKGLAMAPSGKYLYYSESFSDKIGVINTASLSIENNIALDDIDQNTMIRTGGKMFTNAAHTFENQYSCYTCHPDGHEDGLTYDMALFPGKDLANVQTLMELENTSPYKWNGKNVSIYMQCGMRFSKYVTRTQSFSPHNLDALVAYIVQDLRHPPNLYDQKSGELTEAQKRGKAIFERTVTNDGRVIPPENRCITCHPPPHFTNRQRSDVGTRTSKDSPLVFDSPKLNNIYESAPYLHNGSAATLEEIWTKFNPDDKHGMVNDMNKKQLNDLMEYLKCLGSAGNYQ